MKKLLIALIWLTGFIACSNGQTTYYIKNGGNDSADGLSDATAWATISKMRSVTLRPGDSVLFKRGDVWLVNNSGNKFTLNTHSGAEGNLIYYGAYGSGAKPIITARQPLPGWSIAGNWSNQGNNVWRITRNETTNWRRLWFNGKEGARAHNTSNISANLLWYSSGNNIYVYAPSNPASHYSLIESTGNGHNTAELSVDYIKIQNLDIRGGHTACIETSGASYFFIDSCNIATSSSGYGIVIRARYSSPPISKGVVISNSNFHTGDSIVNYYSYNNTEDGISIDSGCEDFLIYGNTLSNWKHAAIQLTSDLTDFPVTDIKVYNNVISAPHVDYGRAFTYNVKSNSFGNEIYNNYVYDTPSPNQISGEHLKFYNNIIDGVRGTQYRAAFSALTLETYMDAARYNEIYNNVIINAESYAFALGWNLEPKSYNIIKNNIFGYSNGANSSEQLLYEDSGEWAVNNTFENNLFYTPNTTNTVRYKSGSATTVANFNSQNRNNDVINNNIEGDPLFVNITNENYLLRDYRLREGSPAIGMGIQTGLTSDKDGNLYNNPPSIGAYEYNPDSVPPPDTTRQASFSIYPNPSGGVLYIAFPDHDLNNSNITIQIYDLSGKIVFQDSKILINNILSLTYNLQPGFYLLKAFIDNIVSGSKPFYNYQ